jgi:hypothetical protein
LAAFPAAFLRPVAFRFRFVSFASVELIRSLSPSV